jgi:hypothetical protein
MVTLSSCRASHSYLTRFLFGRLSEWDALLASKESQASQASSQMDEWLQSMLVLDDNEFFQEPVIGKYAQTKPWKYAYIPVVYPCQKLAFGYTI